ncbi:RagB/SusD family nutrient uptake outer membrane protein [Terrimonas pollutisoli]|uniref:RagB/SusD family nutrient uptake outer membrane protein n=1 Tax=Terrimonas pollutisoli TaxID=3034147 RepID=UPI0023EA8AB3|nr:RagB/SusD family nutrient uptake outer membrane protein [Terrimonas sp. H1YJ31]
MERIKSFLILSLLLTGTFSCKKEFLDETPLDFLSSTNAFKTAADFNASVNNLYRLVRAEFYTENDNNPMEYQYRTDIAFYVPAAFPANLSGEISPTSGIMERHWRALYKIVSEANTVISRIPASEMSDADKTLFEARGRFFRAFAFRSLAYIWGGVPLVTEEVTEPKVDYVRASRKNVYAQVIEDLAFAVANLPGITIVKDGEISNLAAQHLLAEVYLADGQFQNAITAASAVIDDPATDLMTARFGTRKTETPGDVYWDLFRRGNQNRKTAGNTEGIWVIQIEADVPGGAATTATSFASGDGFSLERVHAPLVRDLTINNIAAFRWPTSDYSGGRGVGFWAPSKYFIDSVYSSDPVNDIRNANHNFVRKFKANNPASPYYNTEIDFHNLPAGTKGTSGAVLTSGVPSRAFYPYQTKCTDPGNHPASLFSGAYPMALKGGAGFTYQDQYLFRLAETYLLRAEAYLGAGNTAAAAGDINVVRARSGAAPVAAGDVSIDYILDERIRELGTEEKRLLTLMRLGKWYDRIVKCNPFYASAAQPTYNLWPIPQSEIERNRGAVLEQNTGY